MLWHIYTTEYYVSIKKNELGLYVLTWSDVHDRIFREKVSCRIECTVWFYIKRNVCMVFIDVLLLLGYAFDEGKDFCLFRLLLYHLCLKQCQIHNVCSIGFYSMNELLVYFCRSKENRVEGPHQAINFSYLWGKGLLKSRGREIINIFFIYLILNNKYIHFIMKMLKR